VDSLETRRRALETTRPEWRPTTLAGALDAVAERHPKRPFILTDDATWTYSDVRDWSCRLATGLAEIGIRPGDHVAVVLANYPEWIATVFAIARIGAVGVPVNVLLKMDELGYVLRQSDAVALITMAEFRGLDYLAALDGLAPAWEANGGGERLPGLRRVVTFSPEGRGRDGVPTLEELERRGVGAPPPPLEGDPAAVATLVYTSGTSGAPKGVMLTHDQLLRSAFGSAWTRGFEDGRRILFALPLHHVFAYVEGLLAAMFVGGAVVPQTVFDPVATLRAIARHRVDEALFVPTMTIAVLEAARADSYDVSSLHAVMSAAAPAPVSLWRAVRDELGVAEVITGYGMTETAAATTLTAPDGPLELVAATVGAPKHGAAAGDPALDELLAVYKTIHPETGADLPPGAEGELVVRGPIVTRGYYAKPEETAATIDADGWLRSGDLGRIDPETSRIVLTGRSKELYKCGGELVAPKEVEELLTGHPSVAQAYVVGVPDERMGEVGWAYIVPAPGVAVDEDELIGLCRRRLARFKVPVRAVAIAASDLPVTATGKVQKFRLVERARAALVSN
jgi:fatty-acyl-CoA synthase